jgi:hypothetical protein
MAVDLEKLARQILAKKREGERGKREEDPPRPQADMLVLARRILAESRQKRDPSGQQKTKANPSSPLPSPSSPLRDAFPFASGLKPGQMWGFAELGWGEDPEVYDRYAELYGWEE